MYQPGNDADPAGALSAQESSAVLEDSFLKDVGNVKNIKKVNAVFDAFDYLIVH